MCPESYGPSSVSRLPYYGTNLNNYCAASAPNLPLTSCVGYDPLSMNYSAFGGDIDLTSDYSIGGGFGPGAYAMAGGAYGYNPEAMYQQMDRWTDYMYDRNVKYIEKGRANDARVNTPLERAQYAADALKEKIEKNEQSQIPEFFEAYKQSIRNLYPEYANLSDKDLTARAMRHYQERTNTALKDAIRENGSNIFTQKFLNTVTLGTFGKSSAEETIEKITGNKMSREDNVKGAAGRGAGLLALVTAGNLAFKNRSAIWKVASKNPLTMATLAAATLFGWMSFGKTSAAQ